MAKRKPRTGPLEAAFSKYPGTLTGLSRKLGVSVAALSQWERIPAEHVLMVERLTGVSRYKLRPDIHGRVPPKKSRLAA